VNSSVQEAAVLMHGEKPATLADYCAGDGSDLKEKQPVKANWGGYGEFYPGKITDVNRNGTVDIKYEDGWTEERVKTSKVKTGGTEGKKKLDDAACEVVDKLEDVKKKVKEAERDINLYMTAKEAHRRGIERPKLPSRHRPRKGHGLAAPAPALQPPSGLAPLTNSSWFAPSPGPAPAPVPSAPIPKEKSRELEQLREELAGLDDMIQQLREEIANNDRLIMGGWDDEEDLDDDGITSIDDLIQQFRDRIAEREKELEKLKARRKAQDAQLARVGAAPVSLNNIHAHAKDILLDVEDMRAMRDKLEEEDKLDPELGHALQDLISQGEALDSKISAMVRAEKRAEELRKSAETARREAAERRRKARAAARKAREEVERKLMEEAQREAAKSDDPDKELREASAHAKKMAKKAEEDANAREDAEMQQQEAAAANQEAMAAHADDQAFEAAQEVRSGLDSVASGTQGMDTGVHPNGEKWWRYRYEHSFIEGLLAILVSFLVMCWHWFILSLRGWALRKSRLMQAEVWAHESLYIHWQKRLFTEMVACLFMFLTVWLVGHLGFFEVFPIYIKGHSELHLPTTGHEYRVLAYEMCVIFTFAMILYFCLAVSVVRAASEQLATWERAGKVSQQGATSRGIAGTISGELHDLKRYFVKYVTLEDPEAIDVQSFSFFRYLLIAVRGTVDSMLVFGPLMWVAVLLTFGVFLVLHAYAHIAFIRIMTFFLAVLMATLATMAWVVNSVNRNTSARLEAFNESTQGPRVPETHHKHQSWLVFALMNYALFFLCYGAARTLLQPWLWKLYFYPLLFVAGCTLLLCLIFVFVIAPLVPTYGASLALPPYADVAEVKSLKEKFRDDQRRS